MRFFNTLSFLKNKNFLSALFLLLSLSTATGFSSETRGEAPLFLEPRPVFENNPAFQAVLKKKPGTNAFEMKKIEYLLDRMTHSTCTFIRNGENHPGANAVLHMRWKYSRYHHEIKTAKDFVEKIANASRKTREKYRVKMKSGIIYDAVDILLNELDELDAATARARTNNPKA